MILNSGYQVPSSGGWINFTVNIDNSTSETVVFDFWTESISYNMFYYFPIFVRNDISMSAFSNLSRSPDQYVPPRVNAGTHYYHGYIGDFENLQVYAFDSIRFEKDYNDQIIVSDEWELEGFDNPGEQAAVSIAEVPALLTVYPNPFNPATVLSYRLQVASIVNMSIYDISGRLVTELVKGWQEAGYHEATFDASDLASGVYLARLTAGEFTQTQKLVLLK